MALLRLFLALLTPLANAWLDEFNSWDSSIWSSQPSSHSYSGGILTVTGGCSSSSCVMRSVNTYTASSAGTITYQIYKQYSCDDHFIILSTSTAPAWSWGSTSGLVKFVWNCGSK